MAGRERHKSRTAAAREPRGLPEVTWAAPPAEEAVAAARAELARLLARAEEEGACGARRRMGGRAGGDGGEA